MEKHNKLILIICRLLVDYDKLPVDLSMKYHSYIFLKSERDLKEIPEKTLTGFKNEFLKLLGSSDAVTVYTYSTLGLKVDTNIMLWLQADSLEAIQDLIKALLHSELGQFLSLSYSLFGLTRQTQYSSKSTKHLETNRKGGKYLVIYPFAKTQSWYGLDFETRRNLMGGHVSVGKKYPQIEQLLLYSYGVDDFEFIVSYEMDNLEEFQSLVMELRSDKVREYTLKDTPTFTCIYKSPDQVLDYL